MPRSLILLSTLLMACSAEDDSKLHSAFEAQGFTAQTGVTTDFQIADCAALERCFGNNASAPYLLFNLPGHADDPTFLPDNTVGEVPRVPDNMRSQYYLSENEAIVIAARTPPNAKYFGFTPYMFTRLDDAGARIPVFASLTDSLNPVNIQAGDSGPFDSQVAIIYTSDTDSMSNARAALESQGYTDANINEVVLPRSGMRYGVDPTVSDTFLMMGRVALMDDPTLEDSYLKELPFEVFRLTPESTSAALPVADRMPRGDGVTEDSLEAGLDELGAAITAAAEQHDKPARHFWSQRR